MCRSLSYYFGIVAAVMICWQGAEARDMRSVAQEPAVTQPDTVPAEVDAPYFMECVHNYGNVLFCISNHGMYGSQYGQFIDCESGDPAEGFEFPAGSLHEYLFYGGLWVGAIVDDDTLVSVGVGGWHWMNELWPCADPDCGIEKRSRMPSSPYYDPAAVSDLDHLAEYTDTLDDPTYTGYDWDGATHTPLNITVSQRSYSWAEDDTNEFVIVEYAVRTLGSEPLLNAYIGVFVDGDVAHPIYWQGYLDDISGHRTFFPNVLGCDSIRVAWIADNDGDPNQSGYYDSYSATGIIGVSILGLAWESTTYSYNWWRSNSYAYRDWGPWLADNAYYVFPQGNLGTPVGDPAKYFSMSNGEIDYDQLEAGMDYSSEGWLAPPQLASNLAYGCDTKFLLSVGPVDIVPGDSVEFAVVFAGGHDFHVDPSDWDLFDDQDPGPYQATLDYSSLESNLTLAKLLYDHRYVFPDTGDVNWDFKIDIDDAVGLIMYQFKGGPEPPYLPVCDVNCDGVLDLDDIIFLLDFIFRKGPAPGEGC